MNIRSSLMCEDEFLVRAAAVPLQRINWELARARGVQVFFRRDDLIDPFLSGNKFYKLFYNLHAAKEQQHQQILSFGGAYSNHIYALAAAAQRFGFASVGVIRGERPKHLSATLADAEAWGMKLVFISRADYLRKESLSFLEDLRRKLGDFYMIPEGGANGLGVLGCKSWGVALRQQLNGMASSVCVASGTGGTLAGLSSGLVSLGSSEQHSVIGFSVLKGIGSLGADVLQHQRCAGVSGDNWRVVSGFHCGGYAKALPLSVKTFLSHFEHETRINLDPVYTLKMVWGVAQLLELGYWKPGSTLVLVHTGGLQGRRGFSLS